MKSSIERKKFSSTCEIPPKVIEIFGQNVFGPEHYDFLLGIKLDASNIKYPNEWAIQKIKPSDEKRHLVYIPDQDINHRTINLDYLIRRYQPQQRAKIFNHETMENLDDSKLVNYQNQSIKLETTRPGWYVVPDHYLSLDSDMFSDYLEHSFQIAIHISRHINHDQADFRQAIKELKEKFVDIGERMHHPAISWELMQLIVNSRFRPNLTETILISSLLSEKYKKRTSDSQIAQALVDEKPIWTSVLDDNQDFVLLVPYSNYSQFGLASAAPFYSDGRQLGAICMYPL